MKHFIKVAKTCQMLVLALLLFVPFACVSVGLGFMFDYFFGEPSVMASVLMGSVFLYCFVRALEYAIR